MSVGEIGHTVMVIMVVILTVICGFVKVLVEEEEGEAMIEFW